MMHRMPFSIFLTVSMMYLAQTRVAATTETPVTFTGAGGAGIAGTLSVPSVGQKCPALLLIAGSGPTDRDGNQPPHFNTDLLKQIAASLAERGIATLRFDKRGMYANSKDLPKDKAKFGDFFAWENFVGDAGAGYGFLTRQPQIDAKHIGILGHSEGGLLALEIARSMKSTGASPAAIILLSTPGRPMDVVLSEQLKRLLKIQKATPQQTDFFLAANTRICHDIIEKGTIPPDVPAGLAALYPQYLTNFLHSEMTLDPARSATELTCPVLVMAGAADVQVSADRDAKALDAALSKRPTDVHTLVIVPNASHNLKVVKAESDPGIEGPVAPDAIEQLGAWAQAHLTKAK